MDCQLSSYASTADTELNATLIVAGFEKKRTDRDKSFPLSQNSRCNRC